VCAAMICPDEIMPEFDVFGCNLVAFRSWLKAYLFRTGVAKANPASSSATVLACQLSARLVGGGWIMWPEPGRLPLIPFLEASDGNRVGWTSKTARWATTFAQGCRCMLAV
jgi:hypothetical protein